MLDGGVHCPRCATSTWSPIFDFRNADASQVSRLTAGILLGAGRLRRPVVSAKAYETRYLFFFALDCLVHCLSLSGLSKQDVVRLHPSVRACVSACVHVHACMHA